MLQIDVNRIPPFWLGVLSSIVAAAIVGALASAVPLFRGRLRSLGRRHRAELRELRQKIASADPILRVEGYFFAIIKLLRFMLLGSILWLLGQALAPITPSGFFIISFALIAFVAAVHWTSQLLRPYSGVEIVPPQPGDLIVLSALYGTPGHTVDVSDALRERLHDGRLRTHIGNHLAGDPYPGVKKTVKVKYRYKGVDAACEVNEFEDLSLP